MPQSWHTLTLVIPSAWIRIQASTELAVLSQVQDRVEQVIAYVSRSLTKSEPNYSVTRKELLALVYFARHFPLLLVWLALHCQDRPRCIQVAPTLQGTGWPTRTLDRAAAGV